jgi:ammonium transporter
MARRLRLGTIFGITLFSFLLGVGSLTGQDAPKSSADTKQEVKKEEPKKEETKDPVKEADAKAGDAQVRGDVAWMLTSAALVMLMVPGLALFYGGMVRRKNVLATMMQSMICLSIVGVFWIAIGYSLAFGDPWIMWGGASVLGWSPELVFMRGIKPDTMVPNLNIPVYLHMVYQGMFAIITPALISGALAERIRFRSYLAFIMVWMVVVYCPLAQSVWAMNWNWGYTLTEDADKEAYIKSKVSAGADEAAKIAIAENYANSGKSMTGVLGKMDALDFAGGTVVHIAAGLSSLACFLVLRRRFGYPEHAFHPNSMVLTLTGAGLLWFGWFGFNGGSALSSGTLATSAFTATQAAAAAAGLSWTFFEWFHRGKPTALGFASGAVAGLVAVTPAAGYVLPWAGLVIGLLAGVICYGAVYLKTVLKYDDSLDAFGVHGVGGFFGAVITGFFCWKPVNAAIVNEGFIYATEDRFKQVTIQLIAAGAAAVLAFIASIVIAKAVDLAMGFTVIEDEETTGLDRIEHGETGFDLGLALETAALPTTTVPRSAMVPPNGVQHFSIDVEGVPNTNLMKAWGELCQPSEAVPIAFKEIYPHMTTVKGNRFHFRGGDPKVMKEKLEQVLKDRLKSPVKANVVNS